MRAFVVAGLLLLALTATAPATEYNLANAGTATLRADGPASGADLGWSVAVGDLDGDGKPDLVIGAPSLIVSGARAGAVYVLLGKNGLTGRDIDLATQAADVTIVGDADSYFGWSVAVGAVTGGATADLIVGAARSTGPGGEAVLGAVYIFHGRATWPAQLTPADADVVIWGESAGSEFGDALALGDFNGDGKVDLFVGAPGFEAVGAPSAGKVYGFLGGVLPSVIDLRQPSVSANVEVTGEAGGDRLGQGLTLGDFDGDGYADLAMGAPGVSSPLPGHKEGFPGTVYVIRGRKLTQPLAIDLSSAAPDVRITWPGELNNLGTALAAGDLNGDGLADLAIGAANLPDKSTAGEVFVVFGQYTLPATVDLSTADVTIDGGQAGERFGYALTMGDVSGACLDDLVIGAPNFDSLGVSHVYVIAGGRNLPAQLHIDLAAGGEPYDLIDGAVVGDEAGFALALADLNGAGVEDFLVGAPAESVGNPTRTTAGSVFAIINQATIQPPTANAGPDRTTVVNVPVALDGSGSHDPASAPLTYAWTQIAGPAQATLLQAGTATPLAIATTPGAYSFQLIVANCGKSSAPADVAVMVKAFPGGTDDDTTDDDEQADDDNADDDNADDDNAGHHHSGGPFGSSGKDTGVYGGGGCAG
jgi:hypothetical protein